MIQHAVIIAAGRGMRMSPLTDSIPKPMAPYDGSTLIAKGIEKLKKRVPYIHITVGYKKAILAQHVIEHGASTVFNTEGQGNSWWVYNTLIKDLAEPIYVLTCDNVIELDFDLLEMNYKSLGNPACMIVPVKPIEGFEGDFIFHEGDSVMRFSRTETSEIYCSGIQILNPSKVNNLTVEGDNFYSVWQQLIRKRALKVSSVYPQKWCAVDTIEHLSKLNWAKV